MYKNIEKIIGLVSLFVLATMSLHANETIDQTDVAVETKNIVLLPATFEMYEFGAVTIEKMPDWTETATSMARTSLAKYLPENHNFRLVDLPELSQEETDLVTEHVLLYDYVAGEAISMINTGGPAWKHKKTNFDYSIGNGLDFLRDKAGADLALIYVGADTVTTPGRVATVLVAAYFGAAAQLTGPEIAVAGIIDLHTGEVEWINYKNGFLAVDPREEEGSTEIIGMVFDQYPDSRLLGKKNQE